MWISMWKMGICQTIHPKERKNDASYPHFKRISDFSDKYRIGQFIYVTR